jgi:long-chain fatty acid transport protein
MKRFYSLLSAAVLFIGPVLAGGIVTNTNHSAMFTRMQCRDATTEIDAVYYNPAGLTKISNGLHISLNNQSIFQNRLISSDYPLLTNIPSEYEAKVSAPLFPGVYAAFRFGKFVVSAGFNPIGGGGSAAYEQGVPSFEYGPSDLVPILANQGQPVSAYQMDVNFEGSSVFFGYQANLSYKINDMISLAVGGRLVTAKETYTGYLKDIQLNVGGNWTPATTVFTQAASTAEAAATSLSTAATGLQTAIDAMPAIANLTVSDPAIQGALSAIGLTSEQIAATTNSQAVTALNTAASGYTTAAQQATATAGLLQDQEVDAEKTATGITPIVSVNISPIPILDVAVKYEFKTALEFTNNTTKDVTTGFDPLSGAPITMFPDKAKTHLDIPAMLSVGASVHPGPLTVNGGFHYYFDDKVDWDGREEFIDRGLYEIALGAQFNMGMMAVSAGWLMTSTGVQEVYQTDLSYSLSTNTIGGGLELHLSPLIDVNLAASYTIYSDGEKSFQREMGGEGRSGVFNNVVETYDKDVFIVAVGVNLHIATGD